VTIGYWAPLPPSRTGVADYAAALLAELRSAAPVQVNQPGDIALYQIGNNQLHRAIYERALARPAVVLLHDAVLHHFMLGWLDERAYIEEFRYNYGVWAEDTGRRLWESRARSAADPVFFRYPMLRRITERALAVIVHNPAAARMVRAHCPEARVHIVPHLLIPRPAPAEYETVRLRADLVTSPRSYLFGVFGHLRESKRLATVLRAFRRARKMADIRLLVAGDFVSSVYERAIEPTLGFAIRRRRLGARDFVRHAAAIDACINLRYPSAGETSGIAVHMMGAGKPVLLTDAEENDYPAGSCIRIAPGLSEEEELAAEMVRLAEYRQDGRAVGANAAAWVRSTHHPAAAAKAIVEIMRSCYEVCSANRQ